MRKIADMKLGRLPRAFDARVPLYARLTLGLALPPPPAETHYLKGMPDDLGTMLNDELGDCTCAAWGHANQVWSYNAGGAMVTLPDADILRLYEAMGYVDGDPSTDNGAVEQTVLRYLLTTGLDGNRLTAYTEVDPKNHDDVKRVIADCGVCYIGFEVPRYLLQLDTGPHAIWDTAPKAGVYDINIVGGHAVIAAGYDSGTLDIVSWGNHYQMTWDFWDTYVDEAYGLIDQAWVAATGKTPAGMTLAQLQAAMQALKGHAGPGMQGIGRRP